MDKRGFHKMFIGVIALIILVLIIIYVVVTPRTRESLEQLSQQETAEIIPQNKQEQDNKQPSMPAKQSDDELKDTQTNEKTLNQAQLSELENELLPRRYHDDIYVEAHSIVSEMFLCFIVDITPRTNSRIRASFAAYGREVQFDNSIEKCQKEINDYPFLMQNGEDIGQSLQPTSELGQILKRLIYNEDNDNKPSKDFIYQSLVSVLKSKNGPLIASQASMPFVYFSQGEFIPISSWVNSKNPQYIQQLFQLSLTKLACRYQGGIACQPQGMAMGVNCLSHQAACGLDFISYYEQSILPGMQKDVDILVEKFEAMAE